MRCTLSCGGDTGNRVYLHILEGIQMTELSDFKAKLRTAVANYMSSEGCSCCRDCEAHERHTEKLAKLLRVAKNKSGSWYDFGRYKDENDDPTP